MFLQVVIVLVLVFLSIFPQIYVPSFLRVYQIFSIQSWSQNHKTDCKSNLHKYFVIAKKTTLIGGIYQVDLPT